MSTSSTSSTSTSFHLPPIATYAQSHPIDLTMDEDQSDYDQDRLAKRRRVEHPSPSHSWSHSPSFPPPTPPHLAFIQAPIPEFRPMHQASTEPSSFVLTDGRLALPSAPSFSHNVVHGSYTPPTPYYAPPTPLNSLPVASSSSPSRHYMQNGSREDVIDLTGSPSPPPRSLRPPEAHTPSSQSQYAFSPDLPPKTPVCIGLLRVNALVLYPVDYLKSSQPKYPGAEDEWAPVRLQYERNVNKPGSEDTINIKVPPTRTLTGESRPGDIFGVVEQKVASSLGPMLGKGLIRLDAKVRRGQPNLPILPLHLLVYTPKGNIPVVGNYLHQSTLYLDHPQSITDGQERVGNYIYYNPHTLSTGGSNRFVPGRLGYSGPGGSNYRRWSTPAVVGKSIEVHRSQVDELFKNMKGGDELDETDPPPEIGTKLYSHQKRALTFLLEREQEITGSGGKSSLWQPRQNPLTGQDSWHHLVTQKEVFEEPAECRGAILADDMGLGKTITCVSLIASTMKSAQVFAAESLPQITPPPPERERNPEAELTASHFVGSVWGMPDVPAAPSTSLLSAKAKAKQVRLQDSMEAQYSRACRIKIKSRATLIICPLSTVANWEDQIREHWKGGVSLFGGAGSCPTPLSQLSRTSSSSLVPSTSTPNTPEDCLPDSKEIASAPASTAIAKINALRVYVYHGNARRPDPTFLADCDVVITTYATLASEFSKQSKSLASAEEEEDESSDSTGDGDVMTIRLGKSKKSTKRKKPGTPASTGATSALQSVYWFRVVLDEAHSIKEISTVGCRACCDLMADRRLCLTGTPVQNKLDDIYALIKFLRLEPFNDKTVWTEYIGTPVKYGQPLGVARLQSIMKCITLRRTKESKAQDGQRILSLPPRRDELRYLKFDAQEQAIYDQFFNESKAEFNEMSDKNEVMKNYVGILQKILRLRQICDHFELVKGKGLLGDVQTQDAMSYEEAAAAIATDGITPARAAIVFALLREAATTQCVECGIELCTGSEGSELSGTDESSVAPKRGRRPKNTSSHPSSRAHSPSRPTHLLVLTRCQHLFCGCCYKKKVHPDWPKCPPDLSRPCSVCQCGLLPSDATEVNPNAISGEASSSAKRKSCKKEKRVKGISMEDFHPSTKVKALLGDLVQFSRLNPHSVNYDPGAVEVQMVDGEGNVVDDAPTKSIVFSQWTTMLDKIEDALEAAGIRYDRLDGTMKRDERSRAMDALKNDPGCEVLLVSLKAGGVGLNLTAAQRAYLMDPYWNPAVENQAVDRIHRLGQTKPVTTIKLIIENTIEARLLEVQKKKTELANMTLQNFSKAEMLQRRLEELNQLFG